MAGALYLAHLRTSSFSIRALIAKQLERVDAAFNRWVLGIAWLLGAMANSEAEAEEFGLVWGGDEGESGREESRILVEHFLELTCVRQMLATSWMVALKAWWVEAGWTLLHWRQRFGQWVRDRPIVNRAVDRANRLRAAADLEAGDEADDAALELDIFTSVFFWLLLWDSTAVFVFVTTLFGSIEGAGTGYGWRARQSYYVLYSLFMLSALPFVPFWMAAKVGSGAGMGASTAFNRHGLCIPVNTTGLSAYCIWVLRLIKRWEVRRTLPVAERKALSKEVKRLLEYTVRTRNPPLPSPSA